LKLIVNSYTFDASEKKITFTDYNPIVIERVLVVTNITDNIIIYNFADPAKGGTAATNVLTLTYDTATMADTDKLQIWYDDAATPTPVSLPAATVTTLTPPAAITNFANETGGNLASAVAALGVVSGAAVITDANGTIQQYLRGLVTLSLVDNAVLDNMLTALQAIDNSVDGNYQNVNLNVAGTDCTAGGGTEANSLRVTIANDSTGLVSVDDNAGSLTVDNTSIDGPGKPTIDSYTHLAINLAAGANQLLVSSAANKQIWVYGIGFTTNVAGTVSFQDEDDTAISGIMNIAATSGIAIPPSGNFAMPIWKLATDHDLEVDIVTAEVDGWLDYAIVSV
jgi:hypothetical protein